MIPTYNERENIPLLIPKIFETAKKNKINLEVFIVDDNSPDGTFGVVKQFSKKCKISALKRSKKLGLGSAYVIGFKKMLQRKVDVIFEMDADLSHDPKYIPEFLKSIKSADVVVGSRKIRGGKVIGWDSYRRFLSSAGNRLARFFSGLDVKDLTSGYRAYRKKVLKSINLDEVNSNGYAFQIEMLYRSKKKNFKIKEIPIVFVDRKYGKSKLSKREIFEFFKIGFKMKFGIF